MQRRKIILTIPIKKKCPQNSKINNPKAKEKSSKTKLTIKTPNGVEKKKHQSVQKIKDTNAKKINSQKKELVPILNMFKMLPQAKFRLQQ